MISKEAFSEALDIIRSYRTVIIHRHQNPDGDALGSQRGLCYSLRAAFPEKCVLAAGDAAGRYSFMDGSVMDEVPDTLYNTALVIILDTGASHLVSDERWRNAPYSIRFDHHLLVENFCQREYVDPSYESCCGIVTDFIKTLSLPLPEESARSLYTGMVTDSGRFYYDSVSSHTHELASFLLGVPFDRKSIYRSLYSENLETVKRKAEYTASISLTENNVAWVYRSNEEVKAMGMSPYAISRGFVNTMGNINGVHIWVAFTEDGDKVLCELRADTYNINPVAVAYGGGGHKGASGAVVKDRDEAMRMLSDLDRLAGGERDE